MTPTNRTAVGAIVFALLMVTSVVAIGAAGAAGRPGGGAAAADIATQGIDSPRSERHSGLALSAGTVTLSGAIAFANGDPANGWKVMADGGGNHYATFMSGGNFSLSVAPNTTYNLKYEQYNGTESESWPIDGRPDIHALDEVSVGSTNVSVGEYQLPSAYLLNLTVVNRSGAALENVSVFVQQFANGAQASNDAITDADGSAGWVGADHPGLELRGAVEIFVVGPPGYADNFTQLSVTSNESLTVTLQPVVNVSGSLTAHTGAPAADDALQWHGRDVDHGDANITTDQGNFSAQLIENGTYEVEYHQDNVTTDADVAYRKDGTVDVATFGLVSYGSDTTGLSRTLPAGHNLTVTVVNETGGAIENATVHVVPHQDVGPDDATHAFVAADTNAAGDLVHPQSDGSGFEVNGTVHVHVEPPHTGLSDNGTTVEVTGETHLTVTLHDQVNATGQVLYANGTAPAGYSVSFWGEGGDTEQLSSSGNFTLEVATNQTYRFGFEQTDWDGPETDFPRDGAPDVHAFRTVAVGGSNVAVGTEELPSGNLLNVTVVNQSGAPVSAALVDIGHFNNNASAWIHGETASTGEVLLDHADQPGVEVNGTVHVSVEPPHDGLFGNDTTLEVTSDRQLTIILDPAVTVNGSVEQFDGTPADEDSVTFHTVSAPNVESVTDTDADGNFSVDVAPNRTYNVQYRQQPADRDGYVDVYAFPMVDVGGSDLALGRATLPRGHVLNVTVVTESGTPVEDAVVIVNHENGDAWSTAELVTDGTGAMVDPDTGLTGIEINGSAFVEAIPPADSNLLANDTTLEVDSDLERTIVLEKAVTVNGTLRRADGTESAGDLVVAASPQDHPFDINETRADGGFGVIVPANETYDLSAFQVNETAAHFGERDGSADLHSVARRNDSTDVGLGNVTLPAGHVVNVTVVNETGVPVANASVDVIHTNETTGAEVTLIDNPTNAEGMMVAKALDFLDINRSDVPGLELRGNVTIEVRPPDDTGFVDQTSTRQLNVTGKQNVTVTLEESPVVSGRLFEPDSSAAAGDAVVGTQNLTESGRDFFDATSTDSGGNFSLPVPKNEPVSLTFGQVSDNGTFGPRDGTVDLHEFAEVNISTATDIGTIALPAGDVLNITVIDESDAPVENATVAIMPLHEPTVDAAELSGVHTNANGRFQIPENETPGIELNGTVRVTVRPPENESRFADQTYTREVTVTSAKEITVKLQERGEVEYVPANHSSIQKAVDAVEPNGTVIVTNGTYNETVVIDKPLTLLGVPGDPEPGPNASAPVLDGGNATRVAVIIEDGVSDVTVTGFVVRNYTRAGIGTVGNGTGVSVDDNRFDVPNGTAVFGLAPADESTMALTVRNNVVANATYGLRLVADGHRSVLDLAVANNRISNVSDAGIDVTADGDDSEVTVDIVGNEINASDDGIEDIEADGLNASVSISLLGNSITGQLGSAIQDIHADADNQTVAVWVRDNAFVAATDGVQDLDAEGDGTVLVVSVENNTFDTGYDAWGDLDADDPNQTVTIAIHDNRFTADSDGIDDIDLEGRNSRVNVSITENTFNTTTDGLDDLDADDPNQTVTAVIRDNVFNVGSDGIDDIDFEGDGSVVDVTIERNLFNTTFDGIDDLDADDPNQTVTAVIRDNVFNADSDGIDDIDFEGDGSVVEVTIERNLFNATFDGIDDLDADDPDQTVTAVIRDNVFNAGSDAIDDIDFEGDGSVVTVAIESNLFNASSDGIDDLDADDPNQTVTAVIRDNVFEVGNDAIGDIDFEGDNSLVEVFIANNTINATEDAIDDLDANDRNQTVTILVVDNEIFTGDEGIEDIDVEGDGTFANISILNNVINSSDPSLNDIDGDDPNQTIRLTIVGNTLTSRYDDAIEDIDVDADDETVDILIADNVMEAYTDGIQDIEVNGRNSSINVTIIRNDITTTGTVIVDYDAIQDVHADGDNSTIRLVIAENVIHSDDKGLTNIDADGNDQTVRVAIAANRIRAGNESIQTVLADGRRSTVSVDVAHNVITAGNESLERVVANGTNAQSNVSIHNNTLVSGQTAIGSLAATGVGGHSVLAVTQNDIDAGHHGIGAVYANESEVVIEGNDIDGGGSHGLALNRTVGSPPVRIVANDISNFTAGIRLTAAAGIVNVGIHENRLANNSHAALVNDNGSAKVNATLNWWGANDGPSGDFGGSGDAVFGKAIVEPFYVDADLTTRSDAVPKVASSTTAVAYHSVAVDETVTKRFALVNDGRDTLEITAIRIEGANASAFSRTVDGSTSLAPDEGVDVVVNFTPGSTGEQTARVVVESNDPVRPVLNVSLSGIGRTAEINATPDPLDFGPVSTSGRVTRNVTVTNDGFATLDLTGVSISGPDADAYTVVAGGTGSVVPGGTHVITVAVAPDAPGATNAILSIHSNDPQSPENITLTTAATTPEITVSPTARDFGDLPTDSSASLTVNVTNDGNATLVLSAPALAGSDPGAFRVVNPDGKTFVTPGKTEGVTVAFAPSSSETFSATLELSSNDLDEGTVSVPLNGTGTQANISISPAAVAYGDVRTGTNATANLTITNAGTEPLTLTELSLVGASPGAFNVTAGDLAANRTLQPGDTHEVTVAFEPTAIGSRTAALQVSSDDPATPNVTVSLGGRGVRPDITVTLTSLNFSDTRVAGRTTRAVAVRNDGNANLTVNATRVDAPAWVTRSKSFTLRPGERRNVSATFAPSSAGPKAANLTIPSDDPDEGTINVSLTGTAVTPVISKEPAALQFGVVNVSETKTRNLTLTNGANATASLPVKRVVVIGPDASAFNSTAGSFTLDPGQSRNISVAFTPQTAGDNKTAVLRILTGDPSVPQIDVWMTNSRTIVQVESTQPATADEQGVNVNVTNAPANETLSANVSQPNSRENDVGVDEIAVNASVEVDFTLNLTTSDDPQTANFTRTNVSRPLKFINVSKTISDRNLTNVSFVFRVSKVALDRVNRSPEDVTLYRLNDSTGVWNELNVTLIGETRTHFLYLARAPGFSEFGAGAKKPDFRVEEAQLSVSAIQVGDTIRIVARITNGQDAADGTFQVKLLLDGTLVDSRQVTIASGGTRQVTFVRSFGETGQFTVLVNTTNAGTVTVEAADEAAAEEPAAATATPGGGAAAPPPQASLALEDLTLLTETIQAGESAEVSATVVNAGETAGDFTATFTVNGVPVDSRRVRVPAGESVTVSFSRTFSQAGTFELAINGEVAGELTVERVATPTPAPQPAAPAPSFAVEDVTLEETTVEAGDTVEVTATVVNRGNASGEFTAVLEINDVVIERNVVTVPAGASVEVTFERTFRQAGTFEVSVNGEPAGTVAVAPTPTPRTTAPPLTTFPEQVSPSPTERPGLFTRLPGFGPGVALLALLAFGLLAARRRPRD